MQDIFRFAAAAVVGALLSGCGAEDFTGAYRFKDASMNGTMVLNVHGDEAELFGDMDKGQLKPLGKMKVSIKDKKLLLDAENSTTRLVMKRNVDERSLDCLNCKVIGMRTDEHVWQYDPKGPYDLDQMLKDQARKNEEALNAELQKMQKEEAEKARRNAEAPKLAAYEGDWVLQRASKGEPLIIMGIWPKHQIRVWAFNFETMDRLSYDLPGFEVTQAGLKIGPDASAKLFTLNPDTKVLTCMDCSMPTTWKKADPKKDLGDRHYARKMAGNP